MNRRFGWTELVLGILLTGMGIYSIARPGTALVGVVLVYGLMALATGIADVVFFARIERHTGFGPTLSLVSGVLSVLVGVMLLVHPEAGAFVVSVLFPIWFIAHCVSRLTYLNIIRFTAGNFYYWFTLIVNVIGLVLGAMMLFQPALAAYSADYLISIYLLLMGVDSLVMAFSRRW